MIFTAQAIVRKSINNATTQFDKLGHVANDLANYNTYGYKFVEIEKGEYTCLILYSGDEPFQKATNNYQYLIFAYSETMKYLYEKKKVQVQVYPLTLFVIRTIKLIWLYAEMVKR